MFIEKRIIVSFAPTERKRLRTLGTINISSLPNQRRMRVWHSSGLKSISHISKIAKLTLMVRFPNHMELGILLSEPGFAGLVDGQDFEFGTPTFLLIK